VDYTLGQPDDSRSRARRICSGMRRRGACRAASRASGRHSNPVGSWARSSGGMKRAHIACHRRVAGKLSRHHCRQRSSVRGVTGSCCARRRAVAGVGPRSDTSTTASAKCTRRPRKRTDAAVMRLRHLAQQKLKRLAKSSRTSDGKLRGLRGKWAGWRGHHRDSHEGGFGWPVPDRSGPTAGKT
jgi:hypothetical protein